MPSSTPTESLRGSHPLGAPLECGGACRPGSGWCRQSSMQRQSVRQVFVAELPRSRGSKSFGGRSRPTSDPTSAVGPRLCPRGRFPLADLLPVSLPYLFYYSSLPPTSVALITISLFSENLDCAETASPRCLNSML